MRAVAPTPTGVYLHVDLDVLDLAAAHVNVSAPRRADGRGAVRRGARGVAGVPCAAVSLTAYDPGFDPEGRVPPVALELLRRVAD